MPKIIFIEPEGTRREVQASVGISLMETARQNNVAGVVAQCGGACACATCHVYVAPEWWKRLPGADEMEVAMLENVWEPRENSRLSCQVTVSDAMEGLTVTVPERQA